MNYAALAKYVLWTLYVAATILFIWWGVDTIYDAGVDAEKNRWITKVAKKDAEMAEELGKSIQRLADAKAAEMKHLLEVISEKEKQYAALAKRSATERSGLYVPAQATKRCDSGVSTSSDTPPIAGEEEGQRLPSKIESDLWDFSYEAQRDAVIDYNLLVEKCSKGATIIPD